MPEQWAFHDAVFAHWRGGITMFGFAYKTADGIESGTGHHTKVAKSWLEVKHESQLDRARTRALGPFALGCTSDQRVGWNPDLDSAYPPDLVFRIDDEGSSPCGQNDKAGFQPF